MPRHSLTVGHLRELIKDLPAETLVLVPAPDHSYREVRADVGTALYSKDGWTEDYGEESTPESEYGRRHNVLLIA